MRYGVLITAMLLPVGYASCAPISPANVAIFNGEISPERVDRFLLEYGKRTDLSEFSVASQGGEVLSALKLAKWIKSKKLNVRVRQLCYSSCANYLFIAGEIKYITSGAFVAWHGDAEQVDFRELVARYIELLARQSDGKTLGQDEIIYLRENELKYIGITKVQREQSVFFRDLGVNPMTSRFGQEPIKYASEAWSFTVRAMNALGIRNVLADIDYGEPSYFQRAGPASSMMNNGPLLVFDSVDGVKIGPLGQ